MEPLRACQGRRYVNHHRSQARGAQNMHTPEGARDGVEWGGVFCRCLALATSEAWAGKKKRGTRGDLLSARGPTGCFTLLRSPRFLHGQDRRLSKGGGGGGGTSKRPCPCPNPSTVLVRRGEVGCVLGPHRQIQKKGKEKEWNHGRGVWGRPRRGGGGTVGRSPNSI
jgi:hypothetical protein